MFTLDSARAVLSGGIAGTRALVDQFVKTPSLWLYPPPTRVAYLFSLAAAMKVTSIADFAAGSLRLLVSRAS